MNTTRYVKLQGKAPDRKQLRGGFVLLSDSDKDPAPNPMQIALMTIRLARRLGVKPTVVPSATQLPYEASHDNTIFDAPLLSYATSAKLRFMRGWKQYESCIKGFNGLGLVVEVMLREMQTIQELGTEARRELARRFLATRRRGADAIYSAEQVSAIDGKALDGIADLDLALWNAFADRTIVCSTSSNMGISLHDALRYLQHSQVAIGDASVPLLNADEGALIIWCPDEEADFMNPEKTAKLRALEAEQPPLTRLHTYINRRQRDPGALRDAMEIGGYFFPTNPQSREEMQNLLANAMKGFAGARKCSEETLLIDPKVRRTLETLGCRFEKSQVIVTRGVESGLYGLMAAYLLMLDESINLEGTLALSTWNQASIGAALAAAVLADEQLRSYHAIPAELRKMLREELPTLDAWLQHHKLGYDVRTRIHGVFDIANLQSLAQLLGVVVDKHLSGRGIAFVGLGSSSYSNGNRCYEILHDSEVAGGAFAGKAAFHAATHTLNPVAQALVIAEDLFRIIRATPGAGLDENVSRAVQHLRKPEPAGAAALAGYLLARLDSGTLSLAEIAYVLRLCGFTTEIFLELVGFANDNQGANWFVQEASEEGEHMEGLAYALLHCLDLDIEELQQLALKERAQSQENYRHSPLAPPDFEALKPAVNIYLTGDNTAQPGDALLRDLIQNMIPNLGALNALIGDGSAPSLKTGGFTGQAAAPLPPPGSSMDLTGLVRDIFSRNAEKCFIFDAVGNRNWTYAELWQCANSASEKFVALGLKRGDRIALILPNGAPLAALYFTCMLTGVVAVPINPVLPPSEINVIRGIARVKKTFVASATLKCIDLQTEIARKACIQVTCNGHPGYGPPSSGDANIWAADELNARPIQTRGDLSAREPFLILFTSGTTALPKGVVHSIESELGNAIEFNAAAGYTSDVRSFHCWPMTYSSGILNTLLCPFMAEGSVVFAPTFDAKSSLVFWSPIMEHKVNALWLSPTMVASLNALDRNPQGPVYARDNIRWVSCGTSALPQPTRRVFEDKYGIELLESFGLTETLILSTQSAKIPKLPGSVGNPLPDVEIRIGHENAAEEHLGGEIFAATPYLMLGYINSESGDIERLEKGTFFPTGDIGHFSASGDLFITSRKKDLIIRGGQTISPAAIREVLLSLPEVEDALVVGIPCEFYGEQVAAAIIMVHGKSLSDAKANIIAACRDRLHPAAVPTKLMQVPGFPLGVTGKVLIREVRRMFADKPN